MSNLSVLKLEISSSRYLLIFGVIIHGVALVAFSKSGLSLSFFNLIYGLIVINFFFFVYKDVLVTSATSCIALVYEHGSWQLHAKDGKIQNYLSCRCVLGNSIFTLIELKKGSVIKRLMLFSDQIALEKSHQLKVILKN